MKSFLATGALVTILAISVTPEFLITVLAKLIQIFPPMAQRLAKWGSQ